jgi:hypothetical protein
MSKGWSRLLIQLLESPSTTYHSHIAQLALFLRIYKVEPHEGLWMVLNSLQQEEDCFSEALVQLKCMIDYNHKFLPWSQVGDFDQYIKLATWTEVVGGYWWQRYPWYPNDADRLGWGQPDLVSKQQRVNDDGHLPTLIDKWVTQTEEKHTGLIWLDQLYTGWWHSERIRMQEAIKCIPFPSGQDVILVLADYLPHRASVPTQNPDKKDTYRLMSRVTDWIHPPEPSNHRSNENMKDVVTHLITAVICFWKTQVLLYRQQCLTDLQQIARYIQQLTIGKRDRRSHTQRQAQWQTVIDDLETSINQSVTIEYTTYHNRNDDAYTNEYPLDELQCVLCKEML